MKNRRLFSRQACRLEVVFQGDTGPSVGEIHDIALGGLKARLPRPLKKGQRVHVAPDGSTPLTYEVRWLEPVLGGYEVGLRYPSSLAKFWQSWAAELLAGTDLSHSEIVERRRQVRLECCLFGEFEIDGEEFQGAVLDVGIGGALVETAYPLEESDQVELTLNSPLRVGGLVCRVVRAFKDTSRFGLAFEDLRPRHRLALARLLDFLLPRGLAVNPESHTKKNNEREDE